MRKNFWLYLLSASIYFTQGFEGLPGWSVFFYFKENLHFTESQLMMCSACITLPWLIKPIIGHFIDNYLNKKIWILISLTGSLIFSLILGTVYFPLFFLIALMMGANFNTAIRDISIDGLACVEGKATESTGRLQVIQWGSITAASLLTGFCSGYIAEHWSYKTAYLLLIPLYLLIISVVIKHKSKPLCRQRTNFFNTIKNLLLDKKLLLVCLFLFLYKFSPALGTPLSYIMTDKFGWSKQFLGILDSIGAALGLFGAWLYWHYSKKINLMSWLKASVFVGAITTLSYLYFTPISCMVYTVIFSVIGMFTTLMALDWMAQNTKDGFEATSFALLCSVSNLAGTCNGFVGALLFPIVGLNILIVISSLASFLCLPIIPLLKAYENNRS